MKYRKYNFFICLQILGIFLLLTACSGKAVHEDDAQLMEESFDGNEPASAPGNFSWLNEFEEEVQKLFHNSSSRELASRPSTEILFQKGAWKFSHKEGDHFILEHAGKKQPMQWVAEPKAEGGFFFIARNMAHPMTLSLSKWRDRALASGHSCTIELNYWNEKMGDYRSESTKMYGKECHQMWNKVEGMIL